MSLNHNKYNGRNQITNPFYTPIESTSNYERNVPGAYSIAQGMEEKSMSSLQRAMYRKTVTPSNNGEYHNSSVHQSYSSYNNSNHYKPSHGNNHSRRSKRYEKKNYSYSSGHSYTIGGNNTTNPIYNNTIQRKQELHINVNGTKPRLQGNPPLQSSEEATVNDAYEEIDSENNAKYLETIGRLTAKIEQLEKSSANKVALEKKSMDEYKKEIASLKKSNTKLENELKVFQSKPKMIKDESYIEELKEMQEEIFQLKNELHKTKKDLQTVVQVLNNLNLNQSSMTDFNCKGKEEMIRSISELKQMEKASEKIENSMKDVTSEQAQIIALLSKQLSNIKMINEEQNRVTQCVSKEMNIIGGTKNKYDDMEKKFEEQNTALKNSLQLCESILSS